MIRVLSLSFVIINVIVCDISVAEDVIDLCDITSNYEQYTKNHTQNCGCNKTNTCVRKCCQKGFYLHHYENPYEDIFESVCIKNTSLNSFNVPIYEGKELVRNSSLKDSYLIGMLNCGNARWQYFKMNNSDRKEKFYIQENGSLYYPYSTFKFYSNDRYCIDEQDELTAFLCYTPEKPSLSVARMINTIGMIISMPFLLLTALVFAVVSNASVHRRALMFYCLSLFLACVCLVTVQLHTKQFGTYSCQIFGYSIIFFFMVSFFWMNVMCLDIWFAFGGLIKFSRESKSEKKRFIIYCIYAWGLSLVHVCIVVLINTFGDANSPYHPGVGTYKCFLEDNLPTFIYFYGPITVIIGLNIILFLLTSIKISKIKKTTFTFRRWSTKRSSYDYDKKKFHLYLKLLLAMGVNWSLEIVSWVVQLKQEQRGNNSGIAFIWYISDFCNAIYGLLIFLIFVYRKTVWKTFKKRLYGLLCNILHCSRKSYQVGKLEQSQENNTRTSVSDAIDTF